AGVDAIGATLADAFGALPPLTLERTGYGAGTRELLDRPNIVRVLIGEATSDERPDVSLLEANLDDLNPELIPDAVERCFDAGALDVWTVPAQMKKGRPGVVFSALARPVHEDEVARATLEETTARASASGAEWPRRSSARVRRARCETGRSR